ncbi:Sieve element occlusion, N-terminal [Dillenia turbinata]|uniref:Sieve element occlusion, N-terminal n=1 Tax=Dillenia turbinata TaxID=194707 RepID=A0AAN8Z0Z8_9MAGN
MAKAITSVSKSISSAVSSVLSMSISTSGETTLMNEVLATRAHESADIQFRPVLQVITDIYNLAVPMADNTANGPIGEVNSKEKTALVNFEGAMSAHASLLHKISCEVNFVFNSNFYCSACPFGELRI